MPLKRCRSSLIFNSLILDCIIWGVIKISQCLSREQQSVSQERRRRHAKRLSVLLAQTSRYRADYALLAVHGDLIVRSKLTAFHRCAAERISLRGLRNIGAIIVSSASSQLGSVLMIFWEEVAEEIQPVGGWDVKNVLTLAIRRLLSDRYSGV